jgi:anti-sigma B factor antagonist
MGTGGDHGGGPVGRGDHGGDLAGPGGPGDDGGQLRLSWRVTGEGLAVVAIGGELDLATADQAVRYVREVVDRHHGPVRADLSGLAFCDACGLGALIRIAAYAENSGRRVEFASPSPSVLRIMRLTGVNGRLRAPALTPAAAWTSAG